MVSLCSRQSGVPLLEQDPRVRFSEFEQLVPN